MVLFSSLLGNFLFYKYNYFLKYFFFHFAEANQFCVRLYIGTMYVYFCLMKKFENYAVAAVIKRTFQK